MKVRTILITFAVLGFGGLAVFAYIVRPSAQASAPIEAVPIGATSTQASGDSSTESDAAAATSTPDDGSVLFQISQDESEVRFTLNEELRNVPTTVIGVSNQVAAEIVVNFADPVESAMSVVSINARTLATDSSLRNRAIQNEILDTGTYEFITFTPIAITGLPAAITLGQSFSFQITGDLTIRDVTRSVIFDVTITSVSETRLEGFASTTVLRTDFDLRIPNVPNVANVTDEVLLEIEFVAVPK